MQKINIRPWMLIYPEKFRQWGVSLFIKENIRYIDRDDLLHMNDYIECVFIELEKGEMGLGSNAVIGVIYRPPGTEIKIFNEHLQGILQSINSENKKCYLLGDYNINLLNIDKHTDTNEFLDMMYTHSLFPNITKRTRIYGKSSTLIDNIFSNDLLGTTQTLSGILETDISDHYPVFHIVDMSLYPKENLYQKCRSVTDENTSKFIDALNSQDWTNILSCSDAQKAYTSFHVELSRLYNACFPIKYIKQGYKNRKPWLTKALKKPIKIKNCLFKRYKKYENIELGKKYREYRNKLNGLLRFAEKDHYATLLDMNISNLRNSWRILKEVINKKKRSTVSSKFIINNSVITDKKSVTNGFNTFFTNIGPTLANKIQSSATITRATITRMPV